METQFKTSFIPKKTITSSISSSSAPKKSSYSIGGTILSFVGGIIFIIAILAYIITFVWEIRLENNIKNQVAQLEKSKQEFDENFIQEAGRLNTRMVEAKGILENHLSPSELYALLGRHTLQNVSFKKFSFADNADGTITVTGEGDAARYESIVNQSKAFGDSKVLRNVIFTDLVPSEDGDTVGFSFQATLDPRVVFYRNSLPEINNQGN